MSSKIKDEYEKAAQAVSGLVAISKDETERAYLASLAEAFSRLSQEVWPTNAVGKLTNDGAGNLSWSP